MGVAKAALESSVRYMAAELGPKGIRVHAISPGPLATRAASGIPEFDALLEKAKVKAPARELVDIDDVGAACAFLAHDAARLITGQVLYVDGATTSSIDTLCFHCDRAPDAGFGRLAVNSSAQNLVSCKINDLGLRECWTPVPVHPPTSRHNPFSARSRGRNFSLL